jgi:hypothetical protein
MEKSLGFLHKGYLLMKRCACCKTDKDFAEYHKEYRERNKDRLSEVLYQSRRSNTGKFLYNACKYRAKERGIDFNLDLDDVIIPKICPILKIHLL